MGLNQRFKQKMRQLEASINPSIKKAVNTNSNLLEQQQTEGQFDKGKDALNVSFVPSYATSTKNYKRRNGQPTNRVTLKDSGDLYNSVNIEGTSSQIVFSANVEYFKYLVNHYSGNQILGIQPKAMEVFVNAYICKEIVKNFNIIISK
jgi:hypothetical protein